MALVQTLLPHMPACQERKNAISNSPPMYCSIIQTVRHDYLSLIFIHLNSNLISLDPATISRSAVAIS